jgi:hypothetical protein
MLAWPVATADNLAVLVNLSPQPLGALISKRRLLEQHLSASIRDVVLAHDASP